jgi:hypothetical protein
VPKQIIVSGNIIGDIKTLDSLYRLWLKTMFLSHPNNLYDSLKLFTSTKGKSFCVVTNLLAAILAAKSNDVTLIKQNSCFKE